MIDPPIARRSKLVCTDIFYNTVATANPTAFIRFCMMCTKDLKQEAIKIDLTSRAMAAIFTEGDGNSC